MSFVDDFLRGEKDCMDGIPHKEGQSEAYDAGYSSRYTHEQNMAELSEKVFRHDQ